MPVNFTDMLESQILELKRRYQSVGEPQTFSSFSIGLQCSKIFNYSKLAVFKALSICHIGFMKNHHMRFRPYEPDQLFLLPPDLKQWLPEDDLVYFIIDLVNELNLEPIYELYDSSRGGQPAYNPRMMVGLLLYAYCISMPSSRKIAQATYHSIPFRVLSANQHPDHDTIAEFRSRHL